MVILITIIQTAVFVIGMYFIFIAFSGLFTRRRRLGAHKLKSRFAVIVPAHNEENIISRAVDSIKDMDYPSNLYDIYVIADHCTDNTAEVARSLGVGVWERTGGRRGKGNSLHELMNILGFTASSKVFSGNFFTANGLTFPLKTQSNKDDLISLITDQPYDAAVIIDADNLVAPNFLKVMNSCLQGGEKLIQCCIDAKNPDDNWVTSIFSINFWLNNRFLLQARYNLGFSTLTAGTGVCISREVLQKIGWNTVTLTEDLEFSVQSLLNGFRATFARETRVYDEKPLTFTAACRQRLRWARGQLRVAWFYAPRLIVKGILNADLVRIEGGVRLMQLPAIAAGAVLTILALLQPDLFRDTSLYYQIGRQYPVISVFFLSIPYLLPFIALFIDRLPLRTYRFFIFYSFFYLSGIALILYAVVTVHKEIWVPNKHMRAIDHRVLFQSGRSGNALSWPRPGLRPELKKNI